MEAFVDGGCVRLRNHHGGRFLYADEDGVGVSVKPHPHGASLNAAWMVQRLQRGENHYVLLQSAAYGQYLARDLHPVQGAGPRLVQRFYEQPGQNDLLWVVVEGDGGHVRVGDCSNPPPPPPPPPHNYLGVLINGRSCEYWTVHIVPPRPAPFPLQAPAPLPEYMIWYVLTDDLGNFMTSEFSGYMFRGWSLYALRQELALLLRRDDITLCVRGGAQGRLIRLLVDLPTGHDAFEIIVVLANSTVGLQLPHPNVDAQ